MRNEQNHPRLLSSAEVSAWLGIPLRTLDQWAYLRRGPSFLRVGRHRRYERTEVESWLLEQRHERRGRGDAA